MRKSGGICQGKVAIVILDAQCAINTSFSKTGSDHLAAATYISGSENGSAIILLRGG